MNSVCAVLHPAPVRTEIYEQFGQLRLKTRTEYKRENIGMEDRGHHNVIKLRKLMFSLTPQ